MLRRSASALEGLGLPCCFRLLGVSAGSAGTVCWGLLSASTLGKGLLPPPLPQKALKLICFLVGVGVLHSNACPRLRSVRSPTATRLCSPGGEALKLICLLVGVGVWHSAACPWLRGVRGTTAPSPPSAAWFSSRGVSCTAAPPLPMGMHSKTCLAEVCLLFRSCLATKAVDDSITASPLRGWPLMLSLTASAAARFSQLLLSSFAACGHACLALPIRIHSKACLAEACLSSKACLAKTSLE